MYSFQWQMSPLPMIGAIAGLAIIIFGFIRGAKDPWMYICGESFLFPYITSVVSYGYYRNSFISLFLAQISATFLFFLFLFVISSVISLSRFEPRQHTTSKIILAAVGSTVAAIGLCWWGANVAARCSGARCQGYYHFFGTDLEGVKNYFVTLGGFLLLCTGIGLIYTKFFYKWQSD
ncbi:MULTISPECIES: hypothetical protein [Rhizobium]|uniref:hypothetical protein n=1 Tax=Rhizobium TaxID=379 RepID=UPI00104023EE|nr:hypothetical protein [Rhizobium leguminosarum]MBY5770146.1 hypothetical protein [Rhizobium leguminosarum]TBZ95947.1 hypothetical protein E0H57_33140 [Rhizobium leguminosarum bv. viciae]UFW82467.1 hypothetical protein RlegSU303_32135 [Rhizobium leguminosarum bv. viciae]